MNIDEALNIYKQLIDQGLSLGLFKSLKQVNTAGESLQTIIEHLKAKNHGQSNKANHEEGSEKGSTEKGSNTTETETK